MRSERLAALAVAAAALAPERLVRGGPTLCAFRRLTGRPCPACGLTRSWNAAARLRLRDSIGFHPLGLPALAGALVLAWRPDRVARTASERPLTLALLCATWLAVWLWRLRPTARSMGRPGGPAG